MKEELHSTKQQIQIYSNQATEEDSDNVYKLTEELNNKVMYVNCQCCFTVMIWVVLLNRQIQELEKDNELLKNEIEKARHELQSAEVCYMFW